MRPQILPALPQTVQQVEQALETVFARPEFAPPPRSPVWDWLSRGFRAVLDFLRGLLPGIEIGEGGRTIVFWFVLALLAAAALFISLRAAERLARGAGPGSSRRAGEATEPEGGRPVTGEGWEALAASLAAEGRWREAVHALYQALLHRLAARGAVRIDPAKTPGDYRRESRRDAESYRILDSFLKAFEPLAFGGRPADAGSYQRLLEAARPSARDG